MLTRDGILAKDDLKTELVSLSQWWGDDAYVRTMSGSERDAMEVAFAQQRIGVRGQFAALVLCDETGKRLFADTDAHELGKKSAAALDAILEAGMRLNGMTAGAIADKEKNSEAGQSVSSG